MTGSEHRGDPTDEDLAAEERELLIDRFDNDVPYALGTAVVDATRAKGLIVTVDVRRGAQQVFHVAFPGTTADNDAWVERKVAVVRRFEESSYRVGCSLRRFGGTIESIFLLDSAVFGAHGGHEIEPAIGNPRFGNPPTSADARGLSADFSMV